MIPNSCSLTGLKGHSDEHIAVTTRIFFSPLSSPSKLPASWDICMHQLSGVYHAWSELAFCGSKLIMEGYFTAWLCLSWLGVGRLLFVNWFTVHMPLLHITPFKPHNNFVRRTLLSPFYRWRSRISEMLTNLPKLLNKYMPELGLKPRTSNSKYIYVLITLVNDSCISDILCY